MRGKKCPFLLFDKCVVFDDAKDKSEFLSKDWVRTYCSMCVKSIYARAKLLRETEVKVVNTL